MQEKEEGGELKFKLVCINETPKVNLKHKNPQHKVREREREREKSLQNTL